MIADEAERVDIDGVADGHQHLGDLSGVALSCLHPSQEKGLCHPMRRSDEAERILEAGLGFPAFEYTLKCSHTFNLLDSRGGCQRDGTGSLH